MEDWKPIEGYPLYEVSDQGRVRNASTGRIIKPFKNERTGLLWVPLRQGNRQHTKTIHRLVAYTFLFPPYENSVAIHIDGDRENNRADNLDWKTLSQARDLTSERKRTAPLDPRPVMIIETGEVFENALIAARTIDGREKYILLSAQNRGSMSYKGKHWRFL